jgi:hypothetical protein
MTHRSSAADVVMTTEKANDDVMEGTRLNFIENRVVRAFRAPTFNTQLSTAPRRQHLQPRLCFPIKDCNKRPGKFTPNPV